MPIKLESGRRHGGALFGRREPRYAPAAGGQGGGSPSAGRGSDSRAAVVQCEEAEEGDGEVQSSYRGPFDTMDALQDALLHRREVTKFYNCKSSLGNVADTVFSSEPSKDIVNPENSSPKKRKGLLPFGINQNRSQSKGHSPAYEVTNRHINCRKPLYLVVANSSPHGSRSNDEHECGKNLPCYCLQRRFTTMDIFAPPVALQPQLITVQTRSVPMVGLQDVADSTAVVSPREKRRKN